MRDYTKILNDLPNGVQERIDKDLRTYISSYDKKQDLKRCYDRQLRHFEQNKKLPFSLEDFTTAFRAKNFFKDLDDCGSWLEFRYWVDHDKTKLHHGNFCKRDKLCPACAVRRAYKQQNKFFKIIEENPELLNNDWYYIVIPIKHSITDRFEDLYGYIEQIKKKISMQMRDGRRGKSTGFFSQFDGGMYATEITYGKNGYNPHINLLVNAPRNRTASPGLLEDGRSGLRGALVKHKQTHEGKTKISYSSPELSEWLQQFNGSFVHNITKLDFSNKDEIKSNLVEILKYALKFSSLTNQRLIEVFIKTRNKRLFGTFGNLWGKGLDNVSLDGDEELSGEFLELIFHRAFDYGDTPNYRLYKREVKTHEKEVAELVHTFGVVVPKIAQHKKYYNSAPLILVPASGTAK